MGFGFGRQAGETSTRVATNAHLSPAGRDGGGHPSRDEGRAVVPDGATTAIHGHREGATDGMIDASDQTLGDSQPVTIGLPGYVIADGRVGVREMVDGQLQHRMVSGTLSSHERQKIQENLNSQQRRVQRRGRE